MNQNELNQLVGRNIKLYIEATGKSPKWVYERAGMTKSTYYDLLKGSGDINKNVQKINRLFRINEPFYFYNEQFVPPKTIEQIDLESNLINVAAASYHKSGDEHRLDETMIMLEDFISMIDVLERLNQIDKERS